MGCEIQACHRRAVGNGTRGLLQCTTGAHDTRNPQIVRAACSGGTRSKPPPMRSLRRGRIAQLRLRAVPERGRPVPAYSTQP